MIGSNSLRCGQCEVSGSGTSGTRRHATFPGARASRWLPTVLAMDARRLPRDSRARCALFDTASKRHSMMEPPPSFGRQFAVDLRSRPDATRTGSAVGQGAICSRARVAGPKHNGSAAESLTRPVTPQSLPSTPRGGGQTCRARPPTRAERQFSRRSMRCFGSGFNSPFSTRFTMSVSAAFAGVGMPISSPLRTIRPLRNSISVRLPLTMS